MPTYGYRCEKCGHEYDVWQRMTDEARASCPECGSEGKRLFFPAGIVFKGSGFYKTDSRPSSSDSSTASKKTEKKTDTSSSSAPAAAAAD